MIDFATVTREFRGLVDRRRDLATFLGSAFAAMSLFLTNALKGEFPDSLTALREHIFTFYAFVVMVLSLLLSLRMARLHGGMVLNGTLFARLMQEQSFTRKGDPARSAKHNVVSVSFIQFLLVDGIAGFSTFILLVALAFPVWTAVLAALVICASWLAMYFRFHQKAAAFALNKIATEPVGPVKEEDWREHVSLCLQQANHGLIAEIAFAGLMVFSGFGVLAGLGKFETAKFDLTADVVKQHGPLFFAGLMVATCFLEMIIYLRVRVAIGKFSLQLDPTDRPFRTMRLTDSLIGYALLAFLFAVALHVLLTMAVPALAGTSALLGIDAAAFFVAILAEQYTLARAARQLAER